MPFLENALKALRADDQFVVSYPRSGNTWLRHLICDLICQARHGVNLEGAPPVNPDRMMPDLHAHAPDSAVSGEWGMTRRIFKSHNLLDLRGRRIVYVVRRPTDSLVSYYHLHLRRLEWNHIVASGVDDFCRKNIDGWCGHVAMALEFQRKNPAEILFVTYERLLNRGTAELARCAAFLGLAGAEPNFAAAIERCSFERLRKKEELNPKNTKEFFYRKGREGSGREELNEATVRLISERGDRWYEKAESLAKAGD